MPDAFFATKSRKRKRSATAPSSNKHAVVKKRKDNKKQPNGTAREANEELDDDNSAAGDIDDLELRADDEESVLSDSEYENETPAEKRLRLAQVYLDGLKDELGEGEYDAAEIDREIISARLQKDILDEQGKVYITIADSIQLEATAISRVRLKGHRLPLTCAVCSTDCRYVFSAGKEGSIVKWDARTGKRLVVLPKMRIKVDKKGKRKAAALNQAADVEGHTDEVWCLALSTDGKYLASGGKDRRLGIWNAQEAKWVQCFKGHKDTISSVAFRRQTLQLYSASFDRSVKLFDLSVMGYVETLFGHQDSIAAIAALRRETAVTCGSRDKTVRFWKVAEESQLVFRGGAKSKLRDVLEGGLGHGDGDDGDNAQTVAGEERKFVEGSIDCVAMVDETTFVSGGDSGSLSLWTIQKKKPVFTVPVAHGLHEHVSETEGLVVNPRWITALACLPYSDLLASGSWEGVIRLWKIDANPRNRRMDAVGSVAAPGIVNSLQLLSAPLEFARDAEWAREQEHAQGGDGVDGRGRSGGAGRGVVMLAAVGQEPRTGRWMRLKGDGVVNCAAMFLLRTRC